MTRVIFWSSLREYNAKRQCRQVLFCFRCYLALGASCLVKPARLSWYLSGRCANAEILTRHHCLGVSSDASKVVVMWHLKPCASDVFLVHRSQDFLSQA
jgi:hypothetical protein